MQELIARTIAQAAADGYVTTLLGRRRPIPELRASNRQTRSLGERLAVNTVMQGTAADVIKVAMIRDPRPPARRGPRSRLVLQVHDELLLEVPDTEVSASRSSCGPRWSARIRSIRRSRSTSAWRQLGRREVRERAIPRAADVR